MRKHFAAWLALAAVTAGSNDAHAYGKPAHRHFARYEDISDPDAIKPNPIWICLKAAEKKDPAFEGLAEIWWEWLKLFRNTEARRADRVDGYAIRGTYLLKTFGDWGGYQWIGEAASVFGMNYHWPQNIWVDTGVQCHSQADCGDGACVANRCYRQVGVIEWKRNETTGGGVPCTATEADPLGGCPDDSLCHPDGRCYYLKAIERKNQSMADSMEWPDHWSSSAPSVILDNHKLLTFLKVNESVTSAEHYLTSENHGLKVHPPGFAEHAFEDAAHKLDEYYKTAVSEWRKGANTSVPYEIDENGKPFLNNRKLAALQWLGRALHFAQDVTVPGHTKGANWQILNFQARDDFDNLVNNNLDKYLMLIKTALQQDDPENPPPAAEVIPGPNGTIGDLVSAARKVSEGARMKIQWVDNWIDYLPEGNAHKVAFGQYKEAAVLSASIVALFIWQTMGHTPVAEPLSDPHQGGVSLKPAGGASVSGESDKAVTSARLYRMTEDGESYAVGEAVAASLSASDSLSLVDPTVPQNFQGPLFYAATLIDEYGQESCLSRIVQVDVEPATNASAIDVDSAKAQAEENLASCTPSNAASVADDTFNLNDQCLALPVSLSNLPRCTGGRPVDFPPEYVLNDTSGNPDDAYDAADEDPYIPERPANAGTGCSAAGRTRSLPCLPFLMAFVFGMGLARRRFKASR